MIRETFSGAEQLARALDPLIERAKNPEPALELVGVLGDRACRRNIDRQETPEGQPYEPTARGGTILRDTGILYNGITHQVEGPDGVTIGAGAASSPYNAYQQFGSADYDGVHGNPPRPFIGISDADADEMIEEVADFLDGSAA